MDPIIVRIGDWAVSGSPGGSLKTYALGSCVAVLIYDWFKKIGGMIHIALPDSAINKDRARIQPAYFADTGLPLMIEEVKRRGSVRRNLWVKLVGGACLGEAGEFFDIGRKNLGMIQKILWDFSLSAIAEDTGGNLSRTVSLDLESGEICISTPAGDYSL